MPGDPVEIAKAYDKAGADELVFLDITASSDARETVVDLVRKLQNVFIPFTVTAGGSVRWKDIAQGGRRQDFDQFIGDQHTGTDLGRRLQNSAVNVW